jgi:hypothetical protein
MQLRQPTPDHRPQGREAPALLAPAIPLEELLASGGDGRLTLNPLDRRNSYGCTLYPRPALLDFGSSTASSISPRAYAKVQAMQSQMWLDAVLNDPANIFDHFVEETRHVLRRHLGADGAEVVFSPSGTDAQLQALFLVKALLGAPLTTIIVGADQTGSGTLHTAQGCHFSDRTALGASVEKGTAILGLCEQLRTVAVPFCDEAGRLRTDRQMDAAVEEAVTNTVARGDKVLLQVMDSSKLGWRGPSAACTASIADAWPNDVRIVVDACQMRLGRPQLKNYLDRGYFVLLTGSKFFTGPAFSGALLVPASQAGTIDNIAAAPQGLGSYSTRHDWPRRWHSLRQALPAHTNHGQWLRWEATLEEMGSYFGVPQAFRDEVLKEFAARVPCLIGASPNLCLLTEMCGSADPGLSDEMGHRTIFSFVPQRDGAPLPLEHAAALYRAMGRDVSDRLPHDAIEKVRWIASHKCQIGQPVALRHRPGAALRISASARLVADCWQSAATVEKSMALVLDDVSAVIQKLDWLICNPGMYEDKPQ